MEQEGYSWNVSDLNLLSSAEATDGDSPRCSISGLPLMPVQLRLRRLRKRTVLGFLLSALLLCVTETLPQHLSHAGLHGQALSLLGDVLILALCIQFSMIVVIS